jgi:hypothetical protein
MRTTFWLQIAAVVLAATGAAAHHSFSAEFDARQPFKLTGSVTKVEWTNPHVFFYVDIVDEKSGATTNWAFEMGNVNALMRAGWTRNSLKSGDRVTVEGSRARDGSPLGNAATVVLAATGQRLFTAQGNN